MAEDTQLADRLSRSAARALGGAPRVAHMQRLSGGASQESWRFELLTDTASESLVLRRAPPGRKSGGFSTVDLATEVKLLQVAAGAGVPVPGVCWELTEADACGAGYVMQAVHGETLPRRILEDAQLATARARLAHQCGQTLARLHAIPQTRLPKLPRLTASAQIQQMRMLYDSFGEKCPVLELAMRWLNQHLPEDTDACLVHGDFRNGNLMVDETGLRAVLDWELAHTGDPLEDLGWLCVPSWRFGEIDKPVGGFGALADLFAAYEAVSGAPVDRSRVRFWQCLGTFKWGVICLVQAFTHLSGQRRSVELAMIGRRVSEAEIDLLQVMHPREHITPFAADAAAAPRPTAAELAEAVGHYIQDVAAPELTGRTAFHARVAANALGVIEREARLGPAADAAELQRLQSLLNTTGTRGELNAQLCHGIRNAKLGANTPGLVEHLWATTNARMAIDQPHYASYQKLVQQ